MKAIADLFPERFKSKKAFIKAGGKILNAPSLFVDWSALNDKRCPYCHNLLKLTRRGMYICRGAKHFKKPFAISTTNLLRNS